GLSLPSLRPLAKPCIQLVLVRLAPEQGSKALLLRPGRVSHGLTERLPVGIGHTRDGAPAVLTLTGIGPVWRRRGMAIAGALWLTPAQRIVKHEWRQKIQRHLELCHIQVLATSGASAIIEGRDDSGQRKARHNEVSIRPVRIRWGAIRPARQSCHATQG